MTGVLACIVIGLWYDFSSLIMLIYTVSTLGVTFLCPYLLIWAQKYKSEIRGPWDEATILVR